MKNPKLSERKFITRMVEGKMASDQSEYIRCEIIKQNGYFYARCLEADIFTRGVGLEDVVCRFEEATRLHFGEETEEAEFLATPNDGKRTPELALIISEASDATFSPRRIMETALREEYQVAKRTGEHIKLVRLSITKAEVEEGERRCRK